MTLISFGNFYLGIDPDRTYFFDVQIHFGIFRLEFGGTPPLNVGSDTESSNRCSNGTYPPCVRASPLERP